MTTTNLKNKLTKMNIDYTEKDYNGYNKSILFSINNEKIEADYEDGNNVISLYSIRTGYDNLNQETNYIFFHSFNKVIKWTSND